MLKIQNNIQIKRLMQEKTLFLRLFSKRYLSKLLLHVGYVSTVYVKDCFTPGETQKTSTSSNGSSSSSGDWFASIFNYSKVYILNSNISILLNSPYEIERE